jgi:hypothetical protein
MFAQAPTIGWQKALGGSQFEQATGVIQCNDGGFMVTGIAQSTDGDLTTNKGLYDSWLVKLSPVGSIMWQKVYGGSQSDYSSDIIQTSNGDFVLAGYTRSADGDVSGNHGIIDGWVVRLSGTGAIKWQKCYGGSGFDAILSLKPTSDNGYIVAGWSDSDDGDLDSNRGDSDCWVVKLDSVGNILWSHTLGGSDKDHAASVEQTSDGGYIVAGGVKSNDFDVTGNHGEFDYVVYKLSPSGTLEWKKFYGGSSKDLVGDHGVRSTVHQTKDGGYIVGGLTHSTDGDVIGNHGSFDSWVLKLNDTGKILWQQTIGGSQDDETFVLQETLDSGFVLTGTSNSNDGQVSGGHGGHDFWVVKLNSAGAFVWQQCYGGLGYEVAFGITQTSSGNYVVAGFTDGNSGQVTGWHGHFDAWVAYLTNTNSVEAQIIDKKIIISPNPVSDIITLNNLPAGSIIRVYDCWGKLLMSVSGSQRVSMSQHPPGIYFIHVADKDGQVLHREKIVRL